MAQVTKAFLDMDGVLVDFIGGAHAIHNIKQNVYKKVESKGEWDVVKLLDMTPEFFWKPMGEEFWSKLEWMHDGKLILETVINHFGLQNVCLLTAPCATWGCPEGKRRWIREHLPDFKNPKKYLMGAGKEFAAHPGIVLIDDSPTNIEAFRKEGGKGILVPRIWNEEYHLRDHSARIVAERLAMLKAGKLAA